MAWCLISQAQGQLYPYRVYNLNRKRHEEIMRKLQIPEVNKLYRTTEEVGKDMQTR
jgi:hypothetical protein